MGGGGLLAARKSGEPLATLARAPGGPRESHRSVSIPHPSPDLGPPRAHVLRREGPHWSKVGQSPQGRPDPDLLGRVRGLRPRPPPRPLVPLRPRARRRCPPSPLSPGTRWMSVLGTSPSPSPSLANHVGGLPRPGHRDPPRSPRSLRQCGRPRPGVRICPPPSHRSLSLRPDGSFPIRGFAASLPGEGSCTDTVIDEPVASPPQSTQFLSIESVAPGGALIPPIRFIHNPTPWRC